LILSVTKKVNLEEKRDNKLRMQKAGSLVGRWKLRKLSWKIEMEAK
jgi:hypothetical protein